MDCHLGGGNTLAQALWKIKQERTEKEVDKFLNKLRVYAITDQDVPWDERNQLKTTSHYWMRKTFGKDLFLYGTKVLGFHKMG